MKRLYMLIHYVQVSVFELCKTELGLRFQQYAVEYSQLSLTPLLLYYQN